jgi:hypothetical protein
MIDAALGAIATLREHQERAIASYDPRARRG